MTTAHSYFDRPPPSSIRPSLSHLQASPSSPHTPPRRTASSALNSPSLSYRAEEDSLVFEFGTRHLSAGFTGESYPRCRLGFGTEESRRAGDYRRWIPGFEGRMGRKSVEAWGTESELWRMDLRGGDLGLVMDKIERGVREAYTKFLLVDSKTRRLVVVLPSVLPHQLLSTLLITLFENFFVPSVTLLSSPILSTVAAGLRSALVVDIGWRETVVTSLYEYREVLERRTTRAMRSVCLEMAKLLEQYDREEDSPQPRREEDHGKENGTLSVNVEQAEEVTTRVAWCQSKPSTTKLLSNSRDQPSQANLPSTTEETPLKPAQPPPTTKPPTDPLISLPSPSNPTQPIKIPFSNLALPVEHALLATTQEPDVHDDHETPLHHLIYTSLLHLPPDVRAVCMARIIFTGGGANIPGLKTRLLDEVVAMVEERGWDPVVGKAADIRRERLKVISHNRRPPIIDTSNPKPSDPDAPVPAHLLPQISDPMDEKIQHDRDKDTQPVVQGIIRGVETLGAWAGASLLANLRIKGVVDVDRDAFMQHGLAGARKGGEISVAAPRVRTRMSMGEKQGWTLGAWA